MRHNSPPVTNFGDAFFIGKHALLEGTRKENGGVGETSPRSFRRSIARRLFALQHSPPLRRREKNQRGNSSEGCAILRDTRNAFLNEEAGGIVQCGVSRNEVLVGRCQWRCQSVSQMMRHSFPHPVYDPRPCFLSPFFPIPFIIFVLLFLSSLLVVTQIRGHIRSRLFSPHTHYGSCPALFFARRFHLFLPSSTRVESVLQ